MKIIRDFDGNAYPRQHRGAVVAIGNFDGVHQGHQWLMGVARRLAAEMGVGCGALTFSPHPRQVMTPGIPPFRLSNDAQKLEKISRQGMAFTLAARFTPAFAAMTAEEFVGELLVGVMCVRRIVVGEDYRFGRGRAGDVDLLRRLGRRHGFEVTACAPHRDECGHVYSSSAVRAALAEGRAEDAARLLGRPWEIEGRIRRQRGRAGVLLGEYLQPLRGSYRAQVETIAANDKDDRARALADIRVGSAGGAGRAAGRISWRDDDGQVGPARIRFLSAIDKNLESVGHLAANYK